MLCLNITKEKCSLEDLPVLLFSTGIRHEVLLSSHTFPFTQLFNSHSSFLRHFGLYYIPHTICSRFMQMYLRHPLFCWMSKEMFLQTASVKWCPVFLQTSRMTALLDGNSCCSLNLFTEIDQPYHNSS